MLRNSYNASKHIGKNYQNSKLNLCKIFDVTDSLSVSAASATRAQSNYAYAAATDITETTRFSPQRNRDYSAVILGQYVNQDPPLPMQISYVDITVDNSIVQNDPHVQSYDCGMSVVSLNSAMQSNVPSPFIGLHQSQSHLNMPGGQWSQEGKFMSQQMQSSHYTALRDSARCNWLDYDQYATAQRNEGEIKHFMGTNWNAYRMYCTKANINQPKSQKQTNYTDDKNSTASHSPAISKKDQLKRAFKDYGATVVIFHVTISLASLGCCYLLVSGGIDMVALLEHLGLASSALTNKIATGASTFVVAYAIHKVFAPIRISITLGATPFIVRYLRSKGILKLKK